MWLERSHVLGARSRENSEDRKEHANGFKDGGKDKTLKTRLGEVTVRSPPDPRRSLLSQKPGAVLPEREDPGHRRND